MAVIEHISNQASKPDAPAHIFRNDQNNVDALQNARLQKRLAEEAARLHQQQLAEVEEDKDKVVKERNDLRTEKERLDRELEQRNQSLAAANSKNENLDRDYQTLRGQKDGEIAILKAEKANEKASLTWQLENQEKTMQRAKNESEAAWERKKNDWQNQNNSRDTEIQNLKSNVAQLESKYAYGGKENCLPAEYHNAGVMIVNARSQMGIDAGKDNDNKAHGYTFDRNNINQVFRLEKVQGSGNSSPDNYWTITLIKNGRKLFYPRAGTGWELESGWPSGNQGYWQIGVGNHVGSWLIKNVEYGTYIELANNSKSPGVTIQAYNYSDNWDANWVILPLAWS